MNSVKARNEKFIRLLKEGKNIDEARKECGLRFRQALNIIEANTEQRTNWKYKEE